ncbi:hypothetical protein COTS27_00663 [Spirochaetota bacterium]|nr:hypothetical protein COTS27_00663 [Spirochaetota bacterium]
MKKDRLKKSIKYTLLWIFVIFLSISFIAFFTFEGGSVAPRQQNIVGTVDSYKVINSRGSVFQSFYSRLYEYYNNQTEGGISAAINATIFKSAFDETVNQHLILAEADKNYVYLTEDEVVAGIRDLYGEENFRNILATQDPAIKKQIETNAHYLLRANKFRSTLFFHTPVTQGEQDLYVKASKIQKQVFIATRDITAQINASADDETALLDYFTTHIDRYVTNDSQSDAESPPTDTIDTLIEDKATNSDTNASGTNASTNETESATLEPDSPTPLDSKTDLSAGGENESESEQLTLAIDTNDTNVVRAEFEKYRSTVKEDFLIENQKSIAAAIKTEVLADLKELVTRVSEASAPRNVFEAGVTSLGMTFQVSDYFSYFETEVPIAASEQSVTLPPEFHRELFTAAASETVFSYSEADDNIIYAILVLDTKGAADDEEASAQSSGFVARKYKEQLEEDTRDRFVNVYLEYLTGFAEIFYQDVRQ